MSRKKPTGRAAMLRYDVIYVDGSRTSNRKVSADELTGDSCDDAARAFFEAQDRQIAEASGLARAAIKSVVRSAS
jgi:hypothetical protein